MTSISSSSLFKHICKFCHAPPSKHKKIGRLFLDDRDINKNINESSKEHYFYLINPQLVGSCLDSRKKEKIRLHFVNFSIRDFKTSIASQRKNAVRFNKVRGKNINAVFSCKCDKTYWIISCLDHSFYPELNRKSKIKKVK